MKTTKHDMASCMLSILDTLKLFDKGLLDTSDETLSEMMFRKMKGHGIDLNKELRLTHLKPIEKRSNMENKITQQWIIKDYNLYRTEFNYRSLFKTESGKYFLSSGETGEFIEILKDIAIKLINEK